MKSYLTLALVALLFNFAATANVQRHLKVASTEEQPVVQTSLEEDLDGVIDNDNSVVNTVNTVNTHVNSVPGTVETTHNVVSPVVSPVVAPVVSVEAPTKTATAHHQVTRLVNQPQHVTGSVVSPVHTYSSVQSVQPVHTVSNVVKTQSAPIAKKTYSTVQTVPAQQYYYSAVPQTTQYSSVKGNTVPHTQAVYQQVWQPQSVVYSQWPQTQQYSTVKEVSQYPQTQQYSAVKEVAQWPQTQQYSAVKEVSTQQWPQQQHSVVSSQVWPPQSVVYSQIPQQTVVSVPQQTVSQTAQSVVPQTQQYSAVKEVSTQQWPVQQHHSVVSSQVWPPQSVVYSQIPQQSVVSVPQTQQWAVKDVASQTVYNQPQTVSAVQQPVVRKSVVTSVENAPSKSVQWVQSSPQVATQYSTKTVSQKVPNPLVWKISPVVSKTVVASPQTVLTGAQVVSSDVADESAKSDVVVQEAENY